MIRRRSRTNKKLLDKQILTLHKKLKKNDNIITHYSTEKDYLKGNYHSNLPPFWLIVEVLLYLITIFNRFGDSF